jgi:sugar lactone lactonase YvrE
MTSGRTLVELFHGGTYFECPRWHDGLWWVSDFYRHAVFTYDSHGREGKVVEVEAQPSGLGWLPDGDLLIVSMRDRRIFRLKADATLAVHADISELTTGHVNDMVVDRLGRAYAGNFGFDLMGGGYPAPASLVRVDPDGRASVVAEDLWFPNGSVISHDSTLIVAETLAARLTAFTIQVDGTLTDRHVWAQVEPAPDPADTSTMLGSTSFAPDGCALDAEGCIWVANALGGPLSRVAPGGDIVEEIAIPNGLNVYACGLGGEDGRVLIACAAPDFYEEARSAEREAVLLTTTVDVPHAGLP